MPIVEVHRQKLFQALGKEYTDDEFDELCFEFGIELDDVTTDEIKRRKEQEGLSKDVVEKLLREAKPEDIKYKIDIPANRYDLLCLEGLSSALRTFITNGERQVEYKCVTPASPIQMIVKPETKQIRPFVVCAVLRDVSFTPAAYDSFIELQEKLHQNICRKRTLVAIGTHDLDTLAPPFTYEALKPEEIRFLPLRAVGRDENRERNARELLEYYMGDPHLKAYVPIIQNSPVYPVIYDSKRTVLSLPPIINGWHSRIRPETKNVFIECTATDLTKAKITLNMIVTAFSSYCRTPNTVEAVEVIMPDGSKTLYPDLSYRSMDIGIDYLNHGIGINESPENISKLIAKMGLKSVLSADKKTVTVTVPPTRSDILHPCDVMEDLAIAYGYNKIPATIPKTFTNGAQQPLNKLTDLLRLELAQATYTEVFTFALCSLEENYAMLNKPNDGRCVTLLNPVTIEFQVARTSLLPGLLKTLSFNKGKAALPVRLFEVSDVVLKDDNADVGASNHRRLIALYSAQTASFEIIHGLLDRIMQMLDVKRHATQGYTLKPSDDPTYLDLRRADVLYQGKKIGIVGVLNPQVHLNFGWEYPCSVLEIDIAPFL